MNSYKRFVLVAAIVAAFAVGSFYGSLHFTQAASSLSDAASISQNNTFTGVQNKFPREFLSVNRVPAVSPISTALLPTLPLMRTAMVSR